ncbi:hypothetical protein BJP34_33360 [Moorena producens PAL-8-15-08-1]|uniref:Uncharacterized protein n=1 Tax=Moorena producens PAL-8-15-08-1 TaxID=1458985 RepID=A0A1D8U1B5_9CYAN|nr:hypothetical protein BJP34_33360 [Moorena producens PAL-8-15-08-1]
MLVNFSWSSGTNGSWEADWEGVDWEGFDWESFDWERNCSFTEWVYTKSPQHRIYFLFIS